MTNPAEDLAGYRQLVDEARGAQEDAKATREAVLDAACVLAAYLDGCYLAGQEGTLPATLVDRLEAYRAARSKSTRALAVWNSAAAALSSARAAVGE